MATWWHGITFTVNVGFDTNPLAAFSAPTDVSADLRGMRIFQGRTSVDSGLGVSELALTLGSRTRQYDPDYAAGAHYGDLVKGKRVAVTVGGSLAAATLFTGFAQRWDQTLYFNKDAVVEVPCSGGSNLLDSSTLAGSAYAQEVDDDNADLYWPLQAGSYVARAGTDPTPSDFGGGTNDIATVTSTAPLGETDMVVGTTTGDMLSVPSSPSDMPEMIEFWVQPSGSATGEVSVQAASSSTTYMRVTVSADGDIGFRYSHAGDNQTSSGFVTAQTSALSSSVPYHIALRRDASNLYLYVNGSLFYTKALAAGTTAYAATVQNGHAVIWAVGGADPFGVSHVAFYNTDPGATVPLRHYSVGKWAWSGAHGIYGVELGGGRIGRVLDDCGWPTADRSIDPGLTPMGAYLPAAANAVDYLRQVETAEQGVLCFDTTGKVRFVDRETLWTATAACTFSDDGAVGAVRYYELELNTREVYNVVTASWSNGTTGGAVTQRDATSITAHTVGNLSLDPGTTIDDAALTGELAAYRLREDKDPESFPSRVRCYVRSETNAIAVVQGDALSGLELGDVVSVEYTPMGLGTQVVKRAVVLGIEHDITPAEWLVDVHLAAAPTSAASAVYLTLGTGDASKIGDAQGNLIPF